MERFSAGGEEQEFVFEKTIIHIQPPTLESALALRDPKKKHYSIGPAKVTDLKEAYFICSTDEDSDYRSD